ncbi:hypothetical protein ACFFQW_37360 [Umezawaea endophytica]|uniref:Uncharacterized protein n=1 Tax=Umezawaea endophytica TaxID=1654476 RepID=A0A9X2VVG7_9PSEU|nr:hypothetical protein [Umezawaea endophytica]MCS7483386.1 hypothetical protein [Umezawaea endophytica]
MANDVELPVRLHDLLLALAGRVDDDALSQARELLAVAEPDRAVELVVGCLLAGRIAVTDAERGQISTLLDELNSTRTLADLLNAVDTLPVPRHRFSAESDPADGIADALAKVVTSLPDIRSVMCVWRSTPAGASPGPLPQRLVLVDIGQQGHAPATAYRIDRALRRAGLSAAVEVLRPATQLSDYHAAAVTTAREVKFSSSSSGGGHRDESGAWFDGPEDVRDQAPVVEPTPVPEIPETGSETPSPRRNRAESYEGAQPFPPKPVKRVVREAVEADEEPPLPPALSPPTPPPVFHNAEVTMELGPEDLKALQAALADPNGLPPGATVSVEATPAADAKLSERERALLQQLHEELAQREDPPAQGGADSGQWQIDRSGTQGSFNPPAWMASQTNGDLVNGAQQNNGHPPYQS